MKYIICLLIFFLASTSFAEPLNSEQKTSQHFDQIKNNPALLYQFLYQMPKGGELHTHLSGATYAENLIEYAKDDRFCVDSTLFSLSQNAGCHPKKLLAHAQDQPVFYNAIINRWSLRNFNSTTKKSQDHFFSSFNLFSPIINKHLGNVLSEIITRAADQHENYLELMLTPYDLGLFQSTGDFASSLGARVGWDKDFAKLREKLLKAGLLNSIHQITKKLDLAEKTMRDQLHCDQKNAHPGCQLTVRYQYLALRESQPPQMFAQLLAAFEAAKNDPRIVGINIVQAEDGYIALRDYDLHMAMINYLHQIYPTVHISLHAGELALTDVPPESLRFHIQRAIDIGHAERIGHGVGIGYEKSADRLLTDMSKKSIAVEINLTSNDLLLNVRGGEHPLPLYLQYHVPVVLSTDDEGEFRTHLTREYQRAAQEFHLDYLTLKKFSRNSLTYSFLSGESLWLDPQSAKITEACNTDQKGSDNLSASCKQFLSNSQKAKLQWALEKQFENFEKNL